MTLEKSNMCYTDHDVHDDEGQAVLDCPICYNSMEDKDTTITACKHSFHLSCLLEWFNSSGNSRATCPLCIKNLYKNEEDSLVSDDPPEEAVVHGRRRGCSTDELLLCLLCVWVIVVIIVIVLKSQVPPDQTLVKKAQYRLNSFETFTIGSVKIWLGRVYNINKLNKNNNILKIRNLSRLL